MRAHHDGECAGVFCKGGGVRLQAVILGCGSSGGVPRVGGDWGICDAQEPRNRRTRCSILVRYSEADEGPTTDVLVDTSPDLREQLLGAGVKRIDALVYTHDHADQCHGIDDIRALAYRMRAQVPTFMDRETSDELTSRFAYCFATPEGRAHPPILDAQPLIAAGETFTVDGPGGLLEIGVLGLSHGPTPSLGLLFAGRLAYSPDVHDVPDAALERLQGVHTWICDALRYHAHPTHAHVDKTLSWQARTRALRMVLTNLHIDMDYRTLERELLPSQVPAYDGMLVNAGATD